jgi:cyclohexadienyl dehydratase
MKKLSFNVLSVAIVLAFLFGIFADYSRLPLVEANDDKDSIKININGKTVEGELINNKPYVSAASVQKALNKPVKRNHNNKLVNSRLGKILKKGVIRIGTAGDYKPFTYLNPETGKYEGYDIEATKKLAEDLGVEVQFVKTSWPTLMEDLQANKFDIAMGGITRILDREKVAHLSHPYINFGKSALIREEDKDRFTSLDAIDQPDVKIGLNPGGTNEQFVREHITEAQIIMVEDNLSIPNMVAEGQVDVMITDNVEAILYAEKDPRLYAAFTEDTFTKSQKGYLMHEGEPIFHNWIELWMEEMKLKNKFDQLEEKWM